MKTKVIDLFPVPIDVTVDFDCNKAILRINKEPVMYVDPEKLDILETDLKELFKKHRYRV